MFKRKINITRIKKGKKEEMQDMVLIENPIDIIINSEPFVNIICLFKDLKELAVGFLFSLGIINSMEDIKQLNVNELENCIYIEIKDNNKLENLNINPIGRVIDTTCGIPSPWRDIIKKSLNSDHDDVKIKKEIKIRTEIIFSSIKKMQIETSLYRETGGCHGAAIFDFEGNLIACKEDIGRHNAIDKVIGEIILNNGNFKNKFLTSSGRLTGDCVLKAVRAKLPIVASLSAAVESGIRLAFAYGITLIGFVRGSRMNIYSHPERILSS